jgi:RNA polymerase sigma-70 factor, ECF subfamily
MSGVQVRHPTDAELWHRAVSGDAESMGVLFDRHADAVYNHCFRRVGGWSTAEDLTSVVFLEAWRTRRRVQVSEDGSVLPWLLGVANNMVRNHLRSLRRYDRLLARLPPAGVQSDLADETSVRLDAERDMRRILAVVNRLTHAEKEVLALCAWSGLTYADAAVVLGVPIGTVRSRLSRAKRHVRDLLPTIDPSVDMNSTEQRNHHD